MLNTVLPLVGLLLLQDHTPTRGSGSALDSLELMQSMLRLTDNMIIKEGSGHLREAQDVEFALRLPAGRYYQIAAVCDSDCSDLDMWAKDAGGEVLGGDVDEAATVFMTFQVPASGQAKITASMADCKVAPCAYAYRVFEHAGSGW